MRRELKEITEADLEDAIWFDSKVKKEKVNTVKVHHELFSKLNDYSSLSASEKGEFLEDIVKHILMRWDYSFIEMKDPKMQKYWGDLIVMDSNKNVIRADVKASTTYKRKDKLSMDYEYYKKGTTSPYIPQGADNNFGYLVYLKADTIISINTNSKKLYIVKEFNKLRVELLERMLDFELEEKERGDDIVDISMNRKDRYKDTKIVSIAFTDMKKLGVDVKTYDIIEKDVQNEKDSNATNIQVQ